MKKISKLKVQFLLKQGLKKEKREKAKRTNIQFGNCEQRFNCCLDGMVLYH